MTSTQIIYILTTAIAVSLDSFFAGFAVGYKSGKNFTLPVAAALLTFMELGVIAKMGFEGYFLVVQDIR